MKKKIAILGSTGSIGKSTISIIEKDKQNFETILLTTHKNIKELSKQVSHVDRFQLLFLSFSTCVFALSFIKQD